MINQSLITNEADFLELEKEWKALLPQTAADNIFLTWEWISTWWRVFGRDKSLHILTFRRGTELVGIAPLYIRKIRYYGILPLKALMFLGTGEKVRSEYQDIIIKYGYEDEVVDAFTSLLTSTIDWDIAILKDCRGPSPLVASWQTPDSRLQQVRATWSAENCYAVKLTTSYADYLQSLPKQLRKNINNRRRRLDNKYSVEYQILQHREQLDEWMAALKILHQKRMKQKDRAGKFTDPNYDKFHSAISEQFFQQGWLRLSGLYINAQPAAIRYGFSYGKKVYGYQTGFDPAFARDGVMQVLVSRSIEEGYDSGIAEIDFMAGEDRHKVRFANSVRRIFTLTVFNRTAAGRAAKTANRLRAWTRLAARRRDWPSILKGPFYSVKRSRFYTRTFDRVPPKPGPEPEVEIRKIEAEDLAAVSEISRLKNHADNRIILDRLKRGHICLAAGIGGRPAAFIWIDPVEYHLEENSGRGRLKPGEAFIYDCLTSAHWRGLNIYPLLLEQAARTMKTEGFQAMTMLINTANRPALRAAAKAGFRETGGELQTVKWLGNTKPVRAIPRA